MLTKVLNRHCHCIGKRPDLTCSAIWIFTSSLTPLRLLSIPDITTIPIHTCICSSLTERSVQPITSPHDLKYKPVSILILTMYIHGGFNRHTSLSSYRIMVTETSVVGVMKMGNIVPRAVFKPTSLAFQAITNNYAA